MLIKDYMGRKRKKSRKEEKAHGEVLDRARTTYRRQDIFRVLTGHSFVRVIGVKGACV